MGAAAVTIAPEPDPEPEEELVAEGSAGGSSSDILVANVTFLYSYQSSCLRCVLHLAHRTFY